MNALRFEHGETLDMLRGAGVLIESVLPKRFTLEDVFVDTLGGVRSVGAARKRSEGAA